MKFQPIPRRNFLFLQGPPGEFFWRLAERLELLECGIFRINLNGGDHADWPGLGAAIRATGAARVLVTHGSVGPMVRWLREQGLDADAVDTRFSLEDDS